MRLEGRRARARLWKSSSCAMVPRRARKTDVYKRQGQTFDDLNVMLIEFAGGAGSPAGSSAASEAPTGASAVSYTHLSPNRRCGSRPRRLKPFPQGSRRLHRRPISPSWWMSRSGACSRWCAASTWRRFRPTRRLSLIHICQARAGTGSASQLRPRRRDRRQHSQRSRSSFGPSQFELATQRCV